MQTLGNSPFIQIGKDQYVLRRQPIVNYASPPKAAETQDTSGAK